MSGWPFTGHSDTVVQRKITLTWKNPPGEAGSSWAQPGWGEETKGRLAEPASLGIQCILF